MRRTIATGLALSALAASRAAHADDVDAIDGSPRGVGRAGATLVSDDGAAAVLRNPAGLARRDGRRAQLAVGLRAERVDDARAGAPTATTGQPAHVTGTIFAAGTGGPIIVGVALVDDDRGGTLPAPSALTPPDQVGPRFGHRYAGLGWRREQRTIAVAVAARVNDWLALGVTGSVAAATVEERRRVWAGFSGRDTPGDPVRDVDVTLRGEDAVVPGATFGLLAAPASLPIEVAAAVSVSNAVHAVGDAVVVAADPAEIDVDAARATAALTLASPVRARVGGRWLAQRWSVEGNLEFAWVPRSAATPRWDLDRATLIDRVGVATELTTIASRAARTDRVAASLALDVEILPALGWLTLGVAHRTSATPTGAMTATAGAPATTTVAAGAEIVAGPVTITVGVGHGWYHATAQATSSLGYDDPFAPAAGDVGVADGRGSVDEVALAVELAL